MAKRFLDQMTAWMIGITGTGLVYTGGYGLYQLGLKHAERQNTEKIAAAIAEKEAHTKPAVSPAKADATEQEKTSKSSAEQSADTGKKGKFWTYSGSSGPEKWGTIDDGYRLCQTGKNQSPVDISATYTNSKSLPINFFYGPSRVTLRNTGQTIEGEFSTPSNYISYEGERFDLVQFHFHSPAEHRLQDATLAFEMHLVHRTDTNKLAIVAVLFNSGESNKALAEIFRKMPDEKGAEVPDSISFDPATVIPKKRAYYTYSGSLTTPPCSEGVTWLVIQNQAEISVAQGKKFQEIIGKNARPVQKVGSRRISLSPR